MIEELKHLLRTEIDKMDIQGLERMQSHWDDHKYINNDYESRKEYEDRREIVSLLIIERKLKLNEEEY